MGQDTRSTGQPPGAWLRIGRSLDDLWQRRTVYITAISLAAIAVYLILRFAVRASELIYQIPLFVTLTRRSPFDL